MNITPHRVEELHMVALILWLSELQLDAEELPVPDLDELAREQARVRRPGGLPDRPTDHLPGSPEKVRVMARRARLGQRLFHPADAA